ncbi:MAG: Gfo/Idh/MocA family oxidoreductase [Chloroflexota bacterium]
MASRPLRIGLVGATPDRGWAPRAHVPAYRALEEFELAGICTGRPETAAAAAEAFGVKFSSSDYQEFVRSPEIDVVSVSTRILLHHPISKAALEAGKHVFCEWPLTVTADQAQELADIARSKGVRAITGLQSRFAPAFLHMKELLDQGYLGQMLSFNMTMLLSGAMNPRPSYYNFTAAKSSGFGALSIACGHATDTLNWLVGGIEAVTAQVSTQIKTWTPPDTGEQLAVTSPDNVGYLARLRNGAVGSVQICNTAHAGTGFRLEVFGTGGKLAAQSFGMLELSLVRLTGAKIGEKEAEIALPDRHTWVSGLPIDGPAFNMAQLFRRFGQAIDSGADVPPSFVDGAAMHRMLEAIDRSSDTTQWVTIGQ